MWDFPGGTVVKNPPANVGNARYASSNPGSGRPPWRRAWQPTPVFLPGKNSMDRESWQTTVSKSQAEHSTAQPYQMLRRDTKKVGKVRIPDWSLLKLLENKIPQGLQP